MKVFGLLLCVWLLLPGLLPGAQGSAVAQVRSQALEVVHWWTSGSELRAVNQLRAHLEEAGVQWSDSAVPGGGGAAAVKVLRSRVLMGDPPDVAHLQGETLNDWADRGLVLPLNAVAARQKWSQTLFPRVAALVTHKGDVIAVPVGIHRINTLIYNRRLLDRMGLKPPQSWGDMEVLAAKLQAAGIRPLAWSDEAWQIATVFESLLLGEVGPVLYDEMLVKRSSAAWMQPGVERALQRLRWLRKLQGDAPLEKAWTTTTRELLTGSAAMLIMGDWAYGELLAWGMDPATDMGCVTVPGTARMHLYSVDTLAMLVSTRHRVGLQEKLAETVLARGTQLAFSHVKGSVPVRRDMPPEALQAMDPCARDSWESFASETHAHAPSLAHGMVADEAAKDAVAQALWRFLRDPRATVSETQRRLASVIRAP